MFDAAQSLRAGKQQARKIGALFAARAAPVERVLSSRYCRALDTARIAFETDPEKFEPLDLLSADEASRKAQSEAIIAEIAKFSGSDNLVMVTHLENIRELTGISPREGEAVIVRARRRATARAGQNRVQLSVTVAGGQPAATR